MRNRQSCVCVLVCVCIDRDLRDKSMCLLFRWSVDGACSISSSRRIKYSKSLENAGDVGRSLVMFALTLFMCRSDQTHRQE
jgi:hypothetical protein